MNADFTLILLIFFLNNKGKISVYQLNQRLSAF